MDLDNRVTRIDEELKLVKNEIKEVLLEIQEQVLSSDNPFSNVVVPPAPDHTAAIQQAPTADPPSIPNIGEQPRDQPPQQGYPPYQPPARAGPGPQVPTSFSGPQPSQSWGGTMDSSAIGKQADILGREAELRLREAELNLKESSLAATDGSSGAGIQADILNREADLRRREADSTTKESNLPVTGSMRTDNPLESPALSPDSRSSSDDDRTGQVGAPDINLITDRYKTPETHGTAIEPGPSEEDHTSMPGEAEFNRRHRLAKPEQSIFLQSGRSRKENGRPDVEDKLGPPGEGLGESDRSKRQASQAASIGRAESPEVVDLITVAALAQWTDIVLRKGGKSYFEALLDISEMTGRVSSGMKETLLTFVRLQSDEFQGEGINTREMVALLAQLDGLLGISTSSDSRLLRFLFHDDLETLTSVRP